MEASDRTLMLRYQRGDREAFSQLVRRYQTPLYNYVLRQLGSASAADASTAEDIARQVFLGVVRESASFKEDDSFSTWLFSLALRSCRRERARALDDSSPRVVLPQPWVKAGPATSAGEPSEPTSGTEPIEDSVVRAVDALPEQEKDVYLLREVAGLGFAQIAAVTELGESVVRVRLFQAFERLRTTLQDFEEYRRALR
jgi:RNA polymerase sigma-70 factor, ECF subfamily